MSTDLSRPLVASRGQHDPLDGLLTAETLRATASRLGSKESGPELSEEVRDYSRMVERSELTTTDPLGLGELLCAACRAALLPPGRFEAELLVRVLSAAREGLTEYAMWRPLEAPAGRRLAFRELGLAIGLSAVEITSRELEARTGAMAERARAELEMLRSFESLGETIRSFWSDPEHRKVGTWTEHRAINEVMLATSFVPDGYLT
jgi:hypothetical protein